MVQAMNLEVLGLVISIQGCLVADLCPIPPNQPYVHKQLQVLAFHLEHLISTDKEAAIFAKYTASSNDCPSTKA